MAAKELYDYLSTITSDVDETLTISPQGRVTEEGYKNQTIHLADDNSEERITLSTGSMFFVSWNWNVLEASDAGTVMDLYHDSSKANGVGNTFKWSAHDGHTYVVRFDCRLNRDGRLVDRWGIPGVRLRVLVRIAD